MSDDQALKMYETRAELDDIREEMIQIRNQNNEMRSRLVVNDLMQNVNEFQANISTQVQTIQENVNTLSGNVSSLSAREIEIILLLGGRSGNDELDSLLILENNKESWKQLNIKIPYAVSLHGAQCLNDHLYIFGGYNEKDKQLNCTYKLSKSLQWEKMADMNQKRQYISNSSVLLNNQIWVCGGANEKYEILKSVEMYDPVTNKWKYMKEMNEGRMEAAAAVVNGKIFCSGGHRMNSVECYDPSSYIWTRICNMPHSIKGHGAVEIDGTLIAMGGWNYPNYLKNVWALDTTNKNAVWVAKPSMSIPRDDFSIAKIDDKVFICGGEARDDNKRTDIDNVEIFDGKVWRNGPKMPTSRRDAPAVVIPMELARSLK